MRFAPDGSPDSAPHQTSLDMCHRHITTPAFPWYPSRRSALKLSFRDNFLTVRSRLSTRSAHDVCHRQTAPLSGSIPSEHRKAGSQLQALTSCPWWTRRGSNPRPPDCEPGALPVELRAHISYDFSYKSVTPQTIRSGERQRSSQWNYGPIKIVLLRFFDSRTILAYGTRVVKSFFTGF